MLRRLDILAVEPVATGLHFGEAGPYERVMAQAHGEIDPRHPANRGIALIDKAPRNAQGLVEYQTPVHLMRPVDPARGSGVLAMEITNRGRKLLFPYLADSLVVSNDPRTVDELGNAFPLRQGHVWVWHGWDPGAPSARGGLVLQTPVATDEGKPIVQRVRDEFVSGTRLGVLESFRLSATAVSTDQRHAQLSLRERSSDTPQVLPAADWRFVDDRHIRLREGLAAKPGWLYDFHYLATAPKLQGLGFAVTRDLISFLRHRHEALPLTGRRPSHTLAIGISQGGRYLRDHIGQGFNRDEEGARVFDGVLSHIAGVGRVFLNAAFAQPARTCTRHEDANYPENAFPFASASLLDPVSGRRDALLRGDDSDPRLMEVNTATEYWQKGASLLHTDPRAEKDLELPANCRVYLVAGTQHGGRAAASAEPGPNANPRNPHNPMPALRALWVALEQWVVADREPPPSRVPRLDDGTLVAPEALAFPRLAGVRVPTHTNRIGAPADWVQPLPAVHDYPALVCQVDADGNESAGIRLPDIAVPLATCTGWNTYRAPYPEGELADRDGSRLPFAGDAAARAADNDPRASIAERYPEASAYRERVAQAVGDLLRERLLLPDDAQHYLERASKEFP